MIVHPQMIDNAVSMVPRIIPVGTATLDLQANAEPDGISMHTLAGRLLLVANAESVLHRHQHLEEEDPTVYITMLEDLARANAYTYTERPPYPVRGVLYAARYVAHNAFTPQWVGSVPFHVFRAIEDACVRTLQGLPLEKRRG